MPITGNPNTNTNVTLISGDGIRASTAPTWNTKVQVNDDSFLDTFSAGTRPQFLRTGAVDQVPGPAGDGHSSGQDRHRREPPSMWPCSRGSARPTSFSLHRQV